MDEINVSENEINQVRKLVIEEARENEELYDELDLIKLSNDDWMVKKFIHHKNHNINDAVIAVIKHLKWRKSMSVSSLKPSDFPAEFYRSGELHQYVRDKNNIATIYCRVKWHKPITEFNPLIKKFLVLMMEKAEDEIRAGSNGFALIYDCEGGSLFNSNMDLLSFLITTFFENYPCSLKFIGLIDLPWVLCAIYNICKNLLPETYRKLFLLMDRTTVHEHIGTSYLPDYLGGKCNIPYRICPENCTSLDKIAERESIKQSTLTKFINHYGRLIDRLDGQEKEKKKNDILHSIITENQIK